MSDQSWTDLDKRYLRMACRLALKAAGRTSPNPMVGAVLVRGGKVIATGFHRLAGEDHAEIVALKRAGAKAKGATLYINLEPCSHYGRTPPCSRALIRAGIKEVVAGMKDPNPLVAGMGDARWISSEASRRMVHELRNQVDAVVTGVGTVIADDPHLTCRIPNGRNPWRVILDSRLRIPLTAKLLRQPDPERSIIVTSDRSPHQKSCAIESVGAQVWRVRGAERDDRRRGDDRGLGIAREGGGQNLVFLRADDFRRRWPGND